MADAYEAKPAKGKPEDDKADIHRDAMKRWRSAESADTDNKNDALDDMKFRAGEQWDAKSKKERSDDGRPCLTINRMPQFIRQVTGDLRQNKPAVKVRPVEDSDVALAEVYTGMIRHIEHQSDADTAYITAADHAATGGMGHYRINVDYEADDSFNQCIRVKRIINPFAVYWDPMAQEIDRSDASYCFVVDRISREEFKRRYPDASIADFESTNADRVGAGDAAQGWFGQDTVRIAEYWVKKPEKRKIGLFADGQVLELDSDEAKALGKPLKEREVESHSVCSYIISGTEILDGPQEWAGKHIPIVPVIGEEVSVGDRIVRHGLVRFAKDPQKAFNYMRSASVEAMALQPKAPYLVTVDMISGKGIQDMWENAGKKNYPFLPYKPDPKAPNNAPQRLSPAVAATGLMEEAALAADDMKAVTGIYDAALGAKSNETSGRAIIARDRQGDTGTYVYVDNLAKAIAHGGRIMVDLIPHIYDTERIIRTLGEDGTEAAYIMNRMMNGPSGQPARVAVRIPEPKERNKPGYTPEYIVMKDDAKYDVTVTTGPSYATKRVESAEMMIELTRADPRISAVAGDIIVKNLDLPGAEQLAKRLQKLLPPGIDEDGPTQPPPPDPEAMAKADKTLAEAEGVKLDNVAKELELSAIIPALQAAVQQSIMQLLGGGAPPPPDQMGGPPMGAPPPGPPDMAMMPPPQQPAQDAGFFMPGGPMNG